MEHTDQGVLALFPGQGAQFVGMGKDLFENFAVARETFEEASDSCKLNLKKLCFDGPESDLTLTENTQPALLTVSVASFRVAQTEAGFKPSACLGHSLGEYSALVACGAIPLSKAAIWVRERGQAMQNAVPKGEGGMAAVLGADDGLVEDLCKKATLEAKDMRAKGQGAELTVNATCEPVNYNAPGQLVIAGSKDAVDIGVRMIKEAGFKAIPLQVSAPFHSTLMKPAAVRMASLFRDAKLQPNSFSFPYVPNRTARISHEPSLVFDLLVEQVDNPVLWKQSILGLLEQGYARAVECGPGKVLQGLCKRIPHATPQGDKTIVVQVCGDTKSLKELK